MLGGGESGRRSLGGLEGFIRGGKERTMCLCLL